MTQECGRLGKTYRTGKRQELLGFGGCGSCVADADSDVVDSIGCDQTVVPLLDFTLKDEILRLDYLSYIS
jgi:hypothetical protein